MTGQLLAGAIGIYVWHSGYRKYGGFPTFVPVVSVTPVVIIGLGGTVPSIILGAILGGVFAPPLADYLNKLVAPRFPALVGNTLTMCIVSPIALWIAQAILG